jgi:hypothetical protein
LEKVARRVSDGDVLHLLKMMLKASGKKGGNRPALFRWRPLSE